MRRDRLTWHRDEPKHLAVASIPSAPCDSGLPVRFRITGAIPDYRCDSGLPVRFRITGRPAASSSR
jgi:hypothetical protein